MDRDRERSCVFSEVQPLRLTGRQNHIFAAVLVMTGRKIAFSWTGRGWGQGLANQAGNDEFSKAHHGICVSKEKGKCQEEQGWRCGPSAQARHGHHAIRQNHILLQMNLNFRGNWFCGDLQHDLSDAMMEECGPMYPHTSGRVELAAPALQGQ